MSTYTLRDLPLPVKVVASVFLMAVGLGYGSAMVQLHMQDSKSGKPMPTVDDVIKKYTGKVKCLGGDQPAAPMSRLEALIVGPENIAICGQTMAPAFTTQDRAEGDLRYSSAIKGKTPEQVAAIKAERRGEQAALRLWINTPDDQRKKAYEANRFEPPAGQVPNPLTPAFKDGNAVKVKSIIDARCVTCHKGDSGESKADGIPLDTYAGLAKFMEVSAAAPASPGEYVKVEEPISITKLTQSTHAHLLSFAVLFSLTGLIFAFTSYPSVVRIVGGPFVVVAVFADVALWWLARLSDQWGPYFAMGIIGTGAAAGIGVAAQIILSLFNMYGVKGKAVLLLLFLLGGAIGLMVFLNKIEPALAKKLEEARNQKPHGDPPNGNGKKDGDPNKEEKPYSPVNKLDRFLTLPRRDTKGNLVDPAQLSFDGSDDAGSMAAAFFERDKSKVYPKLMDDPAAPQAEKDRLKAQRQAELDALVAWVRSPDGTRKAAYDTNSFEAPNGLPGKVAPDFAQDGKLKVKSLIDARCAACHSPGKPQKDMPLTNYEELSEYLKPLPPLPAAGPAPAPAPPKGVDPIPPAKDD